MFIKRLNTIFLPTYCTHTRARTRARTQRAAKAFSTRKSSNQDFTTLIKRHLNLYIPRVKYSNRVSFSRRRVKKAHEPFSFSLSVFSCVFSYLRCSRKETLRVHLCFVGGYHHPFENYPFVIKREDRRLKSRNTNNTNNTTRSHRHARRKKRKRKKRQNVGFFFFSVGCFVLRLPRLLGANFAHAAAKAITWDYSAQTVTMLTTDTLTISWTGTHDVYYSSIGTCSGGTSKATSSSYTTTSGDMDVGTHYFYCSIGAHWRVMYATVNASLTTILATRLRRQ